MSHELRTPLNAIIGFSQLMKLDITEPLSLSQTENVDEILNAGKHLLELINDILDLSKIEAGQINLFIEPIAIESTLNDALQLIFPLAQKKDIAIELLLNNKTISFEALSSHQTVANLDSVRLKQILLNLLSNAIKYNCDQGKVIVHLYAKTHKTICISISDTGRGLTADQQQKLFKPFQRLGQELNNEIEGTGIGLVITKKITELMKGAIYVKSKLGKGSCFTVEFPTHNLESHQELKKVTNELSTLPCDIDYSKEQSVLYIEDNPANLRLVTVLIKQLPNVKLWSSPDPKLGIELAFEYQPDLILLDINLPGMNGYKVLENIRKNSSMNNTPIIAITANAMASDKQKGLAAGFDNYITKPFDINALLHTIKQTLLLKDSSGI
ncbi:ATP-binding response regulator [Pseudoalteromonas denitrificans]|uniref:histidine kinase n=1 Tax=Pseudoalteromonas denitrificans DSM 6059 TaxID=1123010 RepID=A0A1I1PQC9_9GAMM|nr:ATP-binding protein [Pseudoalteromonas denitrificans]SFD12094.1 His Kinase A (phospho-acceptor) domain-containing protein [Pseudoalteromonas denitrificans DSM 6059]